MIIEFWRVGTWKVGLCTSSGSEEPVKYTVTFQELLRSGQLQRFQLHCETTQRRWEFNKIENNLVCMPPFSRLPVITKCKEHTIICILHHLLTCNKDLKFLNWFHVTENWRGESKGQSEEDQWGRYLQLILMVHNHVHVVILAPSWHTKQLNSAISKTTADWVYYDALETQ